ncbi:MAG: Ku protein [Rhodothermales bacterium]|nr:Ku protein [Rhodothermales bacterium]
MRAIWKGHIQFSLVTIPIRVYSAIESSETIRFNQLHSEDYGRITYDKRCKKCNDLVSGDQIVKGFEYEPDQYVVVEQSDIEKLRVKSTRIIEIQGFVDAAEVHPTLYDTPYFAGPDGTVGAKTYALLCHTLKKSNKLGVGKVVLRDRESIVLLSPIGPGLLMHKIRYPNELRDIASVPQLEDVKADKDQLQLAQTLVDSMSMSLSDIDLTDGYTAALKDLVKAKVDGKEIIVMEEQEKPVVDIMTALKESIEQAKTSKKPMKKATGKAKSTRKTASKSTSTKSRKKKSA